MTPPLEVEKTLPERSTSLPQAADLVIGYLEAIGVEYVFGVPGGAIEPLYNALARSERRGGIVPVVARHETGAAFMADGYARESGKLGVCCTTTGPGATNAITGVASAYQDDIPLLVITAQTPLESFGRNAVQESSCTAVDTLAMFQHCTHYNTLVSHLKQLPRKLAAAITIAFHARGPVHLSIPLDILGAPFNLDNPRGNQPSFASLTHEPKIVDVEMVSELFRRVHTAKRMVVVIGEGCRNNAVDSIIEFAEMQGALLVTTPQAKGLIDSYHPHYRGICGLAGHRAARELLRSPSVDLIVIAGSGLDEQATQGWLQEGRLGGKIVHIDSLARHFIQSQQADLHIYGNVQAVFEDLLEKLHGSLDFKRSPWDSNLHASNASNVVPFDRRVQDRRLAAGENETHRDRRLGDRRQAACISPIARRFSLAEEAKYRSNASPIKPQRLMYELSRLFPPDTRFLADIGNSFLWGLHYLHPYHGKQNGNSRPLNYFRTSMGFASMGWAIGASIGTALAKRPGPVVCIVGDGSYLMSGQEITTAVAFGLPVIFVVLNDQALGTVKHGQRLAHAEPVGYDLPPVSYAAMASAMGVTSYSVMSPQDLLAINIPAICLRRAPTLIDVHIDGREEPPLSERLDMLVRVW